MFLYVPQVGFVDNQFGLELAISGKGSTNNERLGDERFDDLKQIQHAMVVLFHKYKREARGQAFLDFD